MSENSEYKQGYRDGFRDGFEEGRQYYNALNKSENTCACAKPKEKEYPKFTEMIKI